VQGTTEFLPISSSAHLRLAKYFLGLDHLSGLIYFDLVCHMGTLLALLIFLKEEVFHVLKSVRTIALYFLALLPLIPAYFFLKPLLLKASHPSFLGYSLMTTSMLLFVASQKKTFSPSKKWQHVLCIGVMQTMALIPGISRSGSTITTARLCGWSWKDGALFSFLLAIPTICGGEILESLKYHETGHVSGICYLGGFMSSFVLGLFSVRFIFFIYETGKVRPFAWYCLGAGLVTWRLLHG
ncbi:MAG: hypothetical protein ACD_17C00125G0001, partial [uncultured bacterium]